MNSKTNKAGQRHIGNLEDTIINRHVDFESNLKKAALSSIASSFSASFVNLVVCIYKGNAVCWKEISLVFVAAFFSTLFGLAFVDKVRSAVFHNNKQSLNEIAVVVAVIIVVFCVMYFGKIWSPPGTHYHIERYYAEDVHSVAIAYSFFFDLYKFVGILLLLVSFATPLFGLKMQALRESGYSCLFV